MSDATTQAPAQAKSAAPGESSPDAKKHFDLPPGVSMARVRWWYLVPISLVHIFALFAFSPWLFSWTGLVLMIAGVHVFGQGINIGYHRMLTHSSFERTPATERFFVYLALCCMQDTPVKWVTTHRRHHQYSDEHPDPHTPLVNFFWAHAGWLFLHNPTTHGIDAYAKYSRDLLEQPFYMKLERDKLLWVWIYLAHAAMFFVAGGIIGWATVGTAAEALRMALSLLVWGVLVRTVAVWHITWSVNSLSHVWGYQNYKTRDDSYNNWLVALLTVGEGWHNNHHADPTSASNQHRWWEIDVSYYEIKALEKLGLVWNVKPPRRKGKPAGAASDEPSSTPATKPKKQKAA